MIFFPRSFWHGEFAHVQRDVRWLVLEFSRVGLNLFGVLSLKPGKDHMPLSLSNTI